MSALLLAWFPTCTDVHIFRVLKTRQLKKMRELAIQKLIYHLIYCGARKVFCKIMESKEIWFVHKYRIRLWNSAKYLVKSFLMQNNSKMFSSVWKCVLLLEFHYCNNWVKVISSTNVFLSGYSRKYFFKNTTTYSSCRKGVTFMIR